MCLGHHLKFHGDPEREHKFWIYSFNGKAPENYQKWDFVDDHRFVCTHHQHNGNNEYKCLGHSKGDPLVPTFHGDPSRGHKFWVYPLDKKVITPQWDFRTPDICNNKRSDGKNGDGIEEYTCMGHSITFHGDPSREHSFWLYPKH